VKSLGARPMPRNEYLDWQVPDPGGELTAIGYNQGREAARYTISTAGAAAALRLVSEVKDLPADGEAVAPVRVGGVDAEGRIVPGADSLIHVCGGGGGAGGGRGEGRPSQSGVESGQSASRLRCSGDGFGPGVQPRWKDPHRGAVVRPGARHFRDNHRKRTMTLLR